MSKTLQTFPVHGVCQFFVRHGIQIHTVFIVNKMFIKKSVCMLYPFMNNVQYLNFMNCSFAAIMFARFYFYFISFFGLAFRVMNFKIKLGYKLEHEEGK